MPVALAAILTGCTGPVSALHPFAGVRIADCHRPAEKGVDITYLGAGGFLIEWAGQRIMTAPFYSNPGIVHVVLGLPISPNDGRIARLLPKVRDVKAILVGHAHYDHLMDAVPVAEEHAPDAVVYGSDTAANILASRPRLRGRVRSVEAGAGDWWTPGAWTPVGDRIRFMALRTEHAPHFLGLRLFGGRIDHPLRHLPRTAYGWKQGQALAFVVDFLDRGAPVLRLYYNDAAAGPPDGFVPPLEQLDGRPVDVAILCGASFAEVSDYPEAIVRNLGPRHVLLGHWESFFRSPERAPRPVPLTRTTELATRLTRTLRPEARWHTPLRGASLRVCPRPREVR